MGSACLVLLVVSAAVMAAAVVAGVDDQAYASSSRPVTEQTLRKVAHSLRMYVDELPEMPKVYGYSIKKGSPVAVPLTIGMYAKLWKFHRDLPPTPVFVYGTSAAEATFPGPTIMARQGVALRVRWENHLPDYHILPWDPTVPTAIPKYGGVPTVVHLHGSAHAPDSDGSALAWFTADYREIGPAWTQTTYTYPNVQPPGNLWYHDHALGLTRVNLLAGLLGAYVIHKPEIDDVLDLPEGPECDRHLIICDRSFNVDGSIYMNRTGVFPELHPQWRPEYFGEAMVVNGKAWPFVVVTKRKYRFRILNASNARYLRLWLSNGLPFYIIGSDGSYLSAPVMAHRILLGPAELADVVVDFSQSNTTTAELLNDAPYPYPAGAPAGPRHGRIMKFAIKPRGVYEPPDTSRVPPKEVEYAKVTNDYTVTRYLGLYEYTTPDSKVTHLYINGKRFMDPVTETPRAGSTELWNVINLTGENHPLHLHLGMFQAIKVQELIDLPTFQSCMYTNYDAALCNVNAHAVGRILPIPDHEKTWKNVIKIEPGCMTSIVVKFKIVDNELPYPFDATAEPGYVYHCHMLDHEDNEMIRPLKLLPRK